MTGRLPLEVEFVGRMSAPPRMVALDLDGTILESGTTIRDDVGAALREIASQGVICVTATGRPIDFQLDLFRQFDLDAPAGVFRALIGDEREIYMNDGTDFVSHHEWNTSVRQRWEDLFPLAVSAMELVEAEAAARGVAIQRLNPDEVSRQRGLASLLFETPEDAASLETWLVGAMRERDLPLATNRNVRIVQVYDRLVGKGPTLAAVAALFDIDPGDVLAIGDSSNDHNMLDGDQGFRAATLHNAEPDLKAIVAATGGYIAAARSGEGVVETFRAVGLL